MKTLRAALLIGMLGLGANAWAVDFSFSGFATLGYTQSDQPFKYQRFIDKTGTFRRDSVLGGQIDVSLDHRWGLTAQMMLGPSDHDDQGEQVTLPWAFISYRPTNNLLLRLGKMPVPLFMYSEYIHVGAAYDFARLPGELYYLASYSDFTGGAVNYSWPLPIGDLGFHLYYGRTDFYQRHYIRDSLPPDVRSGPTFFAATAESGGLALNLRRDDDIYRASIHRVTAGGRNGERTPRSFPWVPLGSGIGFYQISDALPGPGVPTAKELRVTYLTLGLDQGLPWRLRLSGELSRLWLSGRELGPDSTGGYIALRRPFGKWTPYLAYAFLKSTHEFLDRYRGVNYNQVPVTVPNADLINFSQRAGADGLPTYDQSSWALGVSYSLTPKSKLKLEVQQAHIGRVSSMVDAPQGGNVADEDIGIFTLSYSLVF